MKSSVLGRYIIEHPLNNFAADAGSNLVNDGLTGVSMYSLLFRVFPRLRRIPSITASPFETTSTGVIS